MKYSGILAILLVGCMLLVGCNNSEPADNTQSQNPIDQATEETQPQEVTYTRKGVRFTFPANFSDYSDFAFGQQYDFLYADAYIGVLGIEDVKADLSEEITSLEVYAANQASAFGTQAEQKDGIWTALYEDLEQNEPQMMVCAFYETENSFWTIKSYCTSDVFTENQDAMWSYVTAATFE